MTKNNWMVQVPIADIIALYGAMEEQDKTAAENKQLRREVDGLRNMLNECMMMLGDLRRQITKA